MNAFWDVFPVIIIFPTFGLMLKWYLEYRIKRELIQRGMVDEKVKYLAFNALEQHAPSSLKWGIVFTFVGLAVLIIQVIPYVYMTGELVLSVMLIAAGVGLLLYYFIASQLMKKHRSGSHTA